MITDVQVAGWARELSATEDEIERLKQEAKAAMSELRKSLAAQKERARHLLALISGREGEQLDLPAAPAPAKAPGKHVDMTCRVEGCKQRSRGARAGFICDNHRAFLTPEEQTAVRARWERLRAGKAQEPKKQEEEPAEEVPGDDDGWVVQKVGAGWHLCHERSPDTYCHEEQRPETLMLTEPRQQIALIEGGSIEPDAVCLECRESRAPVAESLRKAMKLQAKAAKATKPRAERCEATLKSGMPCRTKVNREVSNHFCALHARTAENAA